MIKFNLKLSPVKPATIDVSAFKYEGLRYNHLSAVIAHGINSSISRIKGKILIRATALVFAKVFTKPGKPNKLYVDNNRGLFLSSGIILKFTNAETQRYLKKRSRTWHSFVKAIKLLRWPGTSFYFQDLFGKKNLFLARLLRSGLTINWVFLKLRYHGVGPTKTRRRIKRWIKKKYYQLGKGERR